MIYRILLSIIKFLKEFLQRQTPPSWQQTVKAFGFALLATPEGATPGSPAPGRRFAITIASGIASTLATSGLQRIRRGLERLAQ